MIIYRDKIEGITSDQLNGFFVGWPDKPSPETLLEILRRASFVALALDTESDRVIGFANAISDNILTAYIPLLEVLPAYQKRGIGGALIERLLHRMEHLYMIDLVCDERLVSFYRRLGLSPLQGMAWRNFQNQDGKPGLRLIKNKPPQDS